MTADRTIIEISNVSADGSRFVHRIELPHDADGHVDTRGAYYPLGLAFHAFLPNPLTVLAAAIETVADIAPPPSESAKQTALDAAQTKLIAAAGRVVILSTKDE